MRYPVVTNPAKGEDGFCPDFVLNNVTAREVCNNELCGESNFYQLLLAPLLSLHEPTNYAVKFADDLKGFYVLSVPTPKYVYI